MRRRRLALCLLPWACTSDPTPPASKEAKASNEPAPVAAPTVPEAPSFAEHVAPLVYEHCTPCHHEGGSAPFAFESYDDVRDHAQQIAEVTRSGFMPPWLPAPGSGEFVGARRLSEVQRGTLARWVEQGAVAGELAQAPKPPPPATGWQLGEPDLVLRTGEPFMLPADGGDVYRNFVIPVPRDPPLRFVKAVEIRPGDPKVVHHGVLRVDLTGGVRLEDAEDPAPGFDGMVFAGAGMPDGRFLGWTPGKRPDPGSDARSFRLFGGSDLVLQLHLRPSGKVEPVTAEIGLHFSSRPPTMPALSMELSSGEIDLPPGATDVHVRDQYTVPTNVAVRSVYPHAHYLGKRIEAWAALPDGSKRSLVTIDDWDFDWQDEYRFVRPVRLPAGSTIHMDWSFDNSAHNPHNPSAPPRHVTYGSSSTDEMAELILEVEPDDPRSLPALDEDFRRHWLRGQLALQQRAVQQHPDDADAHANLGAFHQLLGQGQAAIAAYEQALRLDPDHVQANVELGIVMMGEGKLPRAVALLRRAAEVEPTNARTHLVLANALRKQGDDDGAIASYLEALALDEASAEAHNNLGIVLEQRGELPEAARHFQRASELQPHQPLFGKNLARVRSKLGGAPG
ncbi:tetratricopeptide repeat protein [Paraliomyxa miuraensis]|uniref:tetratricopeptide repeat protein n=1 Tax=Paraliomyxa miuraensis TaxID=376150 RepID=UPI00224D8200|nr:tetratricopeptide repeat protein [Paraliomyxa miuraensis]MCX4243395.1 tetratricopeptide repeat protein [Paraliomyxa miuraensis]